MIDIKSTPSFSDDLQKVGRGIRNGEVELFGTEDRHLIDITSSDFNEWDKTMSPHYAEYTNRETGEKYWKKFNRQPNLLDRYTANKVIRKNKDDSFEYVKNRDDGELRRLTKEETIWLILTAG